MDFKIDINKLGGVLQILLQLAGLFGANDQGKTQKSLEEHSDHALASFTDVVQKVKNGTFQTSDFLVFLHDFNDLVIKLVLTGLLKIESSAPSVPPTPPVQ